MQLAANEGEVERVRQEVRAEAMETTLQSMVRLCVVAPTVNVKLNGEMESSGGGGGGGEGTNYTAGFPHHRVRSIIEDDVLPNFVTIFHQSGGEGTAPDGSTKLDSWLEHVLQELTLSIEEHLTDVFKQQ